MSFSYKQTEPQLWTVGHYAPDGKWIPESDHGSQAEASAQVAYLNGGPAPPAAGHAMWCVLGRHGVDVPCSSTPAGRDDRRAVAVADYLSDLLAVLEDIRELLTRIDDRGARDE